MKLCFILCAVFFSQLDLFPLANGADLTMYINSSTKVSVNKDLSSTYGLKFCVRSDNGIVLTFGHTQGVYDPLVRYQLQISTTDVDKTCIRPKPASSVAARNYRTDLVDFTNGVCFWTIWANNWYFVGLGTVWGEGLLMNYRNLTQQTIGGVYAQTKINGQQAYLTLVDESITQSDALTKTASSIAVAQVYAGPVATTNDPNEVTVNTITTTAGGAYQDLGINVGSVSYISFTITTDPVSYGAYIALCDTNNPNFQTQAYEFNPYRYQCMFTVGQGVDQTMTTNLNDYNCAQSATDTERTVWISWANGRLAAGMGSTTGIGTVVAWDVTSLNPINCIKIKSKDINVTWKIPKRYYG